MLLVFGGRLVRRRKTPVFLLLELLQGFFSMCDARKLVTISTTETIRLVADNSLQISENT